MFRVSAEDPSWPSERSQRGSRRVKVVVSLQRNVSYWSYPPPSLYQGTKSYLPTAASKRNLWRPRSRLDDCLRESNTLRTEANELRHDFHFIESQNKNLHDDVMQKWDGIAEAIQTLSSLKTDGIGMTLHTHGSQSPAICNTRWITDVRWEPPEYSICHVLLSVYTSSNTRYHLATGLSRFKPSWMF